MFVIDASIAVKWIVEEEGHKDALALTTRGLYLVAPDIVLAEVAHVLRRKVRFGFISHVQAVESVGVLGNAFRRLVATSDLVEDAFALSSMLDHSVYDCLYLALAKTDPEGCIITADKKFADKASVFGFASRFRRLESVI